MPAPKDLVTAAPNNYEVPRTPVHPYTGTRWRRPCPGWAPRPLLLVLGRVLEAQKKKKRRPGAARNRLTTAVHIACSAVPFPKAGRKLACSSSSGTQRHTQRARWMGFAAKWTLDDRGDGGRGEGGGGVFRKRGLCPNKHPPPSDRFPTFPPSVGLRLLRVEG